LGIGLALAIAAAARTLAGWSGAWMVLAGIELVACIGFLLARDTLAHASEARREATPPPAESTGAPMPETG
ncbi:MAG: hypothetical protein ACYDCK_04735, partial [Thermoplasmatota archaeon]